MKELQNKERIWRSVCGERGCRVRQYWFNSLLGVLHDGGFFSMSKPLFKAGQAEFGCRSCR